jgi:hypothetical protein
MTEGAAASRVPTTGATLRRLRADPAEWRRRGLTPPDAITAMVEERLGSPLDPSYADFFRM